MGTFIMTHHIKVQSCIYLSGEVLSNREHVLFNVVVSVEDIQKCKRMKAFIHKTLMTLFNIELKRNSFGTMELKC